MKNNYKIEDEIEQTLNSLEGIRSAEPNPYFYTRLKARMEKELLQPKKVLGWHVKPIYAYSVLVIVLIINTLTIFEVAKNTRDLPTNEVYGLYDANEI